MAMGADTVCGRAPGGRSGCSSRVHAANHGDAGAETGRRESNSRYGGNARSGSMVREVFPG